MDKLYNLILLSIFLTIPRGVMAEQAPAPFSIKPYENNPSQKKYFSSVPRVFNEFCLADEIKIEPKSLPGIPGISIPCSNPSQKKYFSSAPRVFNEFCLADEIKIEPESLPGIPSIPIPCSNPSQKKYFSSAPRVFNDFFLADEIKIEPKSLPGKPNIPIPYSVQEIVGDSKGSWIVVRFNQYNLGKFSSIRITSLSDKGQLQVFDQESLKNWDGQSAMFNGGQVKVELFVSPNDDNVFYNIKDIIVGDFIQQSKQADGGSAEQDAEGTEALCDYQDNRSASNDNRVGRIMPIGCTGWALKNGAYLTAGHCVGNRMAYLQFDVPASHEDGTVVNPSIDKQYRIIPQSIEHCSNGPGDDWAVFSVVPGKYGLTPDKIYGAFDISNKAENGNVEIAGYGVDDTPVGPPPDLRNKQSQTQQKHMGKLVHIDVLTENKSIVYHRADSRIGNSGSPIYFKEGSGVAIGIHTHTGCNDPDSKEANKGTGFSNLKLWEAVKRKGKIE